MEQTPVGRNLSFFSCFLSSGISAAGSNPIVGESDRLILPLAPFVRVAFDAVTMLLVFAGGKVRSLALREFKLPFKSGISS